MSEQADVLTFSSHDLGVAAYDATELRIGYGGRERLLWADRLAPPRTEADAHRYPSMKYGAYPAFAGPLQLHWRDADGVAHHCAVNLEAVFPGHVLARGEAARALYQPMPLADGEPTILVEIDGRTVNLYLLATLQLAPAAAGAPRALRELRTLAWSRTV